MANFVLLYSGGSMPESKADQAAVMQAWSAWYGVCWLLEASAEKREGLISSITSSCESLSYE